MSFILVVGLRYPLGGVRGAHIHLAKIGIRDVDSNLATAVRTIVVHAMAWPMVPVIVTWDGIHDISGYTLFFSVLSGMATGVSWVIDFKAIQMGTWIKSCPSTIAAPS